MKEHIHQVIEPKQIGKVLPWVHIAIANAKRLLLDVYHDIRPEYLQNYLNEFCWKFNRRNFGEALFDWTLIHVNGWHSLSIAAISSRVIIIARFFAKVARLKPGYNMHFVGGLR